MKNTAKDKKEMIDDSDLWDSRQLGADENYVKVADKASVEKLDEDLGLKAISLRLPIDTVEKLKIIAKKDGLGYQPFIRQLLVKFVATKIPEKKKA